MRRECHGHSERTAAAPGFFQIGEQRVHHLHDGPGRRAERDEAQGGAVQDVGGDGGDSGGGAADRLHHGALCLPEHVHIGGKSKFPLAFLLSLSLSLSFPRSLVCMWGVFVCVCAEKLAVAHRSGEKKKTQKEQHEFQS